MRRILVATDGSEGADRAVDAAAALAAALSIDLWILTVTDGTSSKLVRTLAREEQISIGDARADAVFMGRRGRGRLQGLLLGSVSQKLASLAPCMVVIVP